MQNSDGIFSREGVQSTWSLNENGMNCETPLCPLCDTLSNKNLTQACASYEKGTGEKLKST